MATESLSEQVARLERERDEMRKHFNTMSEAARLAEQRIADVTLERDAWKDATARANSRATERVKAMLVRAEKAEAAVRDLERTLADVTRERDAHRDRADHNFRDFKKLEAELNAAGSRLADAERRGAREALTRLAAQTWAQVRPFPHDTSFDEMVLGFRDRKYPAVPPEREGAGTEGDVRCECGHRYAQHTHRGTACCLDSCSCIRFCPTSPVEGARPSVGKPYGCAKCEREGVHFVGCGDVNCEARPTPPQAAPEPLEVVARSPLGSAFTLTLTPADCRRIVALASRPTASGEG